MNKREGILFLFSIVREIRNSFENPVIFFTQKDYGETIYTALTDIREALLVKAPPDKVSAIVNSFHHQWLEAVQEIEKFKKRIKETPRDVVLNAIDFTKQCATKRYKLLQKYIEDLKTIVAEEEYNMLTLDIKIVDEMKDIVCSALSEKKKYIRSQADQTEYHVKIQDEIEELLIWLDRQNDNLAITFCKVLNLKVPVAPTDLTKTLKQVIEEVAADPTPEAQRVAELINKKGKMLTSTIRISSLNDLEISKVIEKIQSLEERIERLEDQNSSAVMALRHKALYLEERLLSLENIRSSVKRLKALPSSASALSLSEARDVHIFNHLLPHHDRCRLVEQLIQLWSSAILEHDHESIISILSVVDLKEIFSDEKGCFTVDRYGRKIYTKADDEVKYQLDEHNELVPVRDDDRHVYFYDSCGRYYINDTRERVYKDHEGASEYILNKSGYLVKVLEKVDGTEYYYDWLGRYRIDEKGRHIYCEEKSTEEYEHDGLGNLVKIHSDTFCYKPCPIEPITTEENKYLQAEVGSALKECIAAVVLHQPNDPVIYLSERLEKYHYNIKDRQDRLIQEQERLQIQQYIQSQAPKHTTPEHSDTEDESATVVDSNFLEYEHKTEDEIEF
ncbi:uncharacterized protein LOC113505845 [Trichoplusia ni]|uniref:Uncharacterized protein LOC113505845 n=1 Tax=Trichoplusia ni TaxID=7111 RepID=A0A7E5WUG9_TRINI|nr:uncharacterized protein LOC113505845 [Trichoplusia ni]